MTKPHQPDFKSYTDYHRWRVFQDDEFIEHMAKLEALEEQHPDEQAKIDALMRWIIGYHKISGADIGRYRIAQILPHVSHATKKAHLLFDPHKKQYSIEFEPDVTRQEIIDEFGSFEQFREKFFPTKSSKRKMPAEPELLYAIHKYRQHGRTFAHIFARYEEGKLPGSKGQFDTMYELRRYYYNNRPA